MTRLADSRALWVVVAFGAIAGVVLRVVVYRSSLGVLDGDEAVWGLMARHVLDGELSAFFWGQGYGGTQEVLATAPLFALFGTSTVLMRVVPVALTAVAAVLVWRIGRRTIGDPGASAAAVLLWVWPPYLTTSLEVVRPSTERPRHHRLGHECVANNLRDVRYPARIGRTDLHHCSSIRLRRDARLILLVRGGRIFSGAPA